MIEQFFQIGENWIDKEQYAFQLGDAILFLCFLIFVLYLFVFSVYSKRKPQYNYPTAKKKYRFAVLFPAYQEDEVIIDSVKSFLSQEYSKGLYDIIVISNQMRQETIDNLKTMLFTQVVPHCKPIGSLKIEITVSQYSILSAKKLTTQSFARGIPVSVSLPL